MIQLKFSAYHSYPSYPATNSRNGLSLVPFNYAHFRQDGSFSTLQTRVKTEFKPLNLDETNKIRKSWNDFQEDNNQFSAFLHLTQVDSTNLLHLNFDLVA